MKRAAIILKGAVAKKVRQRYLCEGSMDNLEQDYVNITAAYNCTKKHIIDCNPEYQVDIFIHCWNKDLEKQLNKLYKPKLSKYEDNKLYTTNIKSKMKRKDDFGGISCSISLKKAIELKEQYELANKFTYNVIMIYRPDILLWKDIVFSKYDMSVITVNAHPNCIGDFHFIMNSVNANKYKCLYDSIDLGNYHKIHHWIKNFIVNILQIQLVMDDIEPGKYQEVFKTLRNSIKNKHITVLQLNKYGFTDKDLF